MLQGDREIEIMAAARQPNLRDATRSRIPFENVASDFLGKLDLQDSTILDLGPGQYDFAEVVAARGATVLGIDNDPAVIQLGEHKQYEVIEADLRDSTVLAKLDKLDGIFCKGSINAFWFAGESEQQAYIDTLCSLIRPGGWAWIAPWNGLPSTSSVDAETVSRTLACQERSFREHGFSVVKFGKRTARRYGLQFSSENRVLYLKGLPIPRLLRWFSLSR